MTKRLWTVGVAFAVIAVLVTVFGRLAGEGDGATQNALWLAQMASGALAIVLLTASGILALVARSRRP
jgi:hypothetical protein